MKKLSATLLLVFVLSAVSAVWYSSNTTLTSGTYNSVGWGSTMTIAANSNVNFTGSTNFSGGALVIQSNATLTISGQFNINGSITMAPGSRLIVNGNFSKNSGGDVTITESTIDVSGNFVHSSAQFTVGPDSRLNVNGSLTINNGNFHVGAGARVVGNSMVLNGNNSFAGLVDINNTVRISGGNNSFSGCGEFQANTLQIQNGNTISGNGFLNINTLDNGSRNNYSGHQLTNSSAIGVYRPGAATNQNWGAAYMHPSATNPCMSTLPIGFNEFKAVPQVSNQYMLEWVAPETEETDRFEIEVSEDGVNFRTIQVIPATGKRGDQFYQRKIQLAY